MNSLYKDGMMGLITGDAVGRPVQFEPRENRVADPVTDMRDRGCFGTPKGSWTDDSSLALATLYSIKSQGGIDLIDMGNQFAAWLKKGEFTPLGYAYDIGISCTYAINRFLMTGDPDTCGGRGEKDNGNGSLMRILPACIYAYDELTAGRMDLKAAISSMEAVSALTHATVRAKLGCGIYFFLVAEVMNYRNSDSDADLLSLLQAGIDKAIAYYEGVDGYADDLQKYSRLFDLEAFMYFHEDGIRSTGYVVDSLEAAVWSLVNTDDYQSCILKAVNLGHDTDTIAAIAGGLAGLYYGYDSIPDDWRDSIMRKKWIEDMCS